MDLRTYLFKNYITIKEFSESIGYHRSYVSQIINEFKLPGTKLALKIEEATKGEVKASNYINKKIRKMRGLRASMDLKAKDA